MKRIGIFGWGLVAPKCPNIDAFEIRLRESGSWLEPYSGFGKSNFLTGVPDFTFASYKKWIETRFNPSMYTLLMRKMDETTLYAVGAFIQALQQNPGIVDTLEELGPLAHVYVGTGMGSIATIYRSSVESERLLWEWEEFWATPVHNECLRRYLEAKDFASSAAGDSGEIPRKQDRRSWNHYWAMRSPELAGFLEELALLDDYEIPVGEPNGKAAAMAQYGRKLDELFRRHGAPRAPWNSPEGIFWNLHNTPAAQISILGKITGLSFAPVAACSTFGVALHLAVEAIRSGRASAVVVGATDASPQPMTVGAFHSVKVHSPSRTVESPLTRLHGTHLAGGSVIWIVADYEKFDALGYRPVGMEICGVGVSSDAQHLVTPSRSGPLAAIGQAMSSAEVAPDDMSTWDMHATGTPGDWAEVGNLQAILSPNVILTARKGTFGHGLAAGGGWELTAQHLGGQAGVLFPTSLRPDKVHPSIAELKPRMVYDGGGRFPEGYAGKLSMGVGGINACVISRPWPESIASM